MVRVYSNHAYYQYLTKYSPEFLRRTQSLQYHLLGRGSGFERLVRKFSCDHLGTEEVMGFRYLAPVWFVKISNRMMWSFTAYYWIYCMHCLGDQGQLWNVASKNAPNEQYDTGMQPFKYERIYALDKPVGRPPI